MSTEKLRNAFIELVNSITNEFIKILDGRSDDYSNMTRHIHIFIHDRIDSMLVLTNYQCFWDADILLRSIAEASVKLVYISHFNDNNSNEKVVQFWKDLSEINRLKQSKQLKDILNLIKIDSKELQDLILSEYEENQLRSKWSKQERQKIEQPWSFNEMIKVIAKETNQAEIICLNRTFTQSSHLIHADETALGVILDRKQRTVRDKKIQEILHEKRLYSDSLSLYLWILDVTTKIYNKSKSDELKNAILKYFTIDKDLSKEISSENEM